MTEFSAGTINKAEIETLISKALHLFGVPANIKGYLYLRDAIIMKIYDPSVTDLITKELYPNIARLYHATPSSVERAIRHALTIAWQRGFDDPVIISIFPIRKVKPKNSEFICEVANYIIKICNMSQSRPDWSRLLAQ